MILKLEKVSKKIKKKDILVSVNAEFDSGMVYGIVGRNGSGKTMLFRAVSGLMDIDSGRILLDEKELGKDVDILPSVGMILENAGLYPDLTGFENLKYLSKLKNRIGDKEIIEAIKRVGLESEDKRTFRKYSLGMKQRLVIAQAIMEKPDVLLLDEPTNALDEEGVELLRNIVIQEKQRGAIILLASHSKEDIELLADKVYYMQAGKISEEKE